MSEQPDGIHTIPVPEGWSAEQAWEAIRRGDQLPEPPQAWVNCEVKDGRFVRLIEPEIGADDGIRANERNQAIQRIERTRDLMPDCANGSWELGFYSGVEMSLRAVRGFIDGKRDLGETDHAE